MTPKPAQDFGILQMKHKVNEDLQMNYKAHEKMKQYNKLKMIKNQ